MPGIANNWHHSKNQFDSVKFFEGTSDEKDRIIYQLRETLEEKDKALKEMAEKNKALEKELEEFRKR
jgi:hypothetical protein